MIIVDEKSSTWILSKVGLGFSVGCCVDEAMGANVGLGDSEGDWLGNEVEGEGSGEKVGDSDGVEVEKGERNELGISIEILSRDMSG